MRGWCVISQFHRCVHVGELAPFVLGQSHTHRPILVLSLGQILKELSSLSDIVLITGLLLECADLILQLEQDIAALLVLYLGYSERSAVAFDDSGDE